VPVIPVRTQTESALEMKAGDSTSAEVLVAPGIYSQPRANTSGYQAKPDPDDSRMGG